MAVREYQFINGPETSSLPAIGVPSDDSDLISLGFARKVTGTRASPTLMTGASALVVTDALKEIIFVAGSGGPILAYPTLQIEAGAIDCQELILIGRHDTNTVTFEDGSGLDLNGRCVLRAGSVLHLIWDGTNWLELGRAER